MFDQQFNEARVVGKDINWPRLDLGKNAFMELLDLKRHGYMLAKTLTRCNDRGHDTQRTGYIV